MFRQKEHTVVKKECASRMDDNPLTWIPFDRRQHWTAPAMIFGGLEFCGPALMAGATLAASFSLKNVIFILFAAFIGVQWVGNTINGYMGAKTGRAAPVLARGSFGAGQARVIIAMVIFLASIGWWSIQTAVAGNAICAAFGIDYSDPASFGIWAAIVIAAGVIFAAPSIIGYPSMKLACRVTIPAGLTLAVAGVYMGQRSAGGFAQVLSYMPEQGAVSMTFAGAMSIVLGVNISQWVIAADYTRRAKPGFRDSIIIPLGVITVGLPFLFAGAFMSAGQGTADIVEIMVKLGFPFWGFILLWLSTWTSQLVNNYSMGLAFGSLLNVSDGKGRMYLTVLGTVAALAIAISGVLDHFIDFLLLTSLLYAPIAGIMASDFFLRWRDWEDNSGWNWMATLALVFGAALGYYTTFVRPAGIPVIQCSVGSGLIYAFAMLAKAAVKPDSFTPQCFHGLSGLRAEISGTD